MLIYKVMVLVFPLPRGFDRDKCVSHRVRSSSQDASPAFHRLSTTSQNVAAAKCPSSGSWSDTPSPDDQPPKLWSECMRVQAVWQASNQFGFKRASWVGPLFFIILPPPPPKVPIYFSCLGECWETPGMFCSLRNSTWLPLGARAE